MALIEWLRNALDKWVQEVGEDALDTGTKELAKFLASWVPTRMSEQTLRQLAHNPNKIQIMRGVRLLIPNKGIFLHLANEFVDDFFDRLAACVKEAERTTRHPEDLEDVIQEEANGLQGRVHTLALIELAMNELDEPTRDRFGEWFKSTRERQVRFVKLVDGLTKGEIMAFMTMDPTRLEELISQVLLPHEITQAAFYRLRLEVDRDPKASALTSRFLRWLNRQGPNQTVEFWRAVEAEVTQGRIRSVDDYRNRMSVSNAKILDHLHMKLKTKSAIGRYTDWRKTSIEKQGDSGLMKWSADLRKKSQRFAKGQRGRRR